GRILDHGPCEGASEGIQLMALGRLQDTRQFLQEQDVNLDSLNQRFHRLYQNFNVLEYTTTDPDGTRKEERGYSVLLFTGGNYYLTANIDGNKTWKRIICTDGG